MGTRSLGQTMVEKFGRSLRQILALESLKENYNDITLIQFQIKISRIRWNAITLKQQTYNAVFEKKMTVVVPCRRNF